MHTHTDRNVDTEEESVIVSIHQSWLIDQFTIKNALFVILLLHGTNHIHTYIHTSIQYETKPFWEPRRANGTERPEKSNSKKKKTKTSRRRRPIPHHCRAAPILEELIVNLPTEKYSIQNLKQTKKKDNSKSPIVSQSGYRHRRNKPPPPPP